MHSGRLRLRWGREKNNNLEKSKSAWSSRHLIVQIIDRLDWLLGVCRGIQGSVLPGAYAYLSFAQIHAESRLSVLSRC